MRQTVVVDDDVFWKVNDSNTSSFLPKSGHQSPSCTHIAYEKPGPSSRHQGLPERPQGFQVQQKEPRSGISMLLRDVSRDGRNSITSRNGGEEINRTAHSSNSLEKFEKKIKISHDGLNERVDNISRDMSGRANTLLCFGNPVPEPSRTI